MRGVWDNLDNGDDDDDDDDDYLQRCGNGVCSWRGCKIVENGVGDFLFTELWVAESSSAIGLA